MAEGFFRKYAPKNYIPISAGTRPVSNVNPLAIEVMREIGIDISEQKPKILTEDAIKESSVRKIFLSHIDGVIMATTAVQDSYDERTIHRSKFLRLVCGCYMYLL
jgi:hypothetical protein